MIYKKDPLNITWYFHTRPCQLGPLHQDFNSSKINIANHEADHPKSALNPAPSLIVAKKKTISRKCEDVLYFWRRQFSKGDFKYRVYYKKRENKKKVLFKHSAIDRDEAFEERLDDVFEKSRAKRKRRREARQEQEKLATMQRVQTRDQFDFMSTETHDHIGDSL